MTYLEYINLTTLYMVFLLSILVMIAILLILKPIYQKSYFNYFIIGYSLQLIGGFFSVLRDSIPLFIAVILSNILIMAAIAYEINGYKKMLDKPLPRFHHPTILGLYTLGLAYFTYVSSQLSIRIILFSVCVILLSGVIIRDSLIESFRTRRVTVILLLLTYLLSVGNNIWRAVVTVGRLDYTELFSNEYSFKIFLIINIITIVLRVIVIMFYHQKDLID